MEVGGVIIRHVILPAMGLDWAYQRTSSAVARPHCLGVIYGRARMDSFVGFVQIFLFPPLPDCFVEVGARNFWALIFVSKENHYGQAILAIAWEGYQKAALYIPKRRPYSWKVLCTDVGRIEESRH